MPGLSADFVIERLQIRGKPHRDSGQSFAGSEYRELPGLKADFGAKVPVRDADLGPDC